MFKLIEIKETDADIGNVGNCNKSNMFNTYRDELIYPDDTIELCVSFIKQCQEKNEQPHRLRGPYIAMLLLYKKLVEKKYDVLKFLGK